MKAMFFIYIFLAVASAAAAAFGAEAARATVPFEINEKPNTNNPVDALVLAALRTRGIEPAYLCADAVFLRRLYLDVTGMPPEPAAVRKFLDDPDPDKRAKRIEALLGSEDFADYWTMKWCDLLRVKAEFPINLWPNAVQAYHRWLRTALKEGMPYDQFVRELLTASGGNFRTPQVNFYRAIQGRRPADVAAATALTFMGVRVEHWTDAQRAGPAAFFSRIAYKGTAEWKEEIVQLNPAPVEPFDAVFPDGRVVRIMPDQDPRRVFADWLISADNHWFARNIVNRIWYWLMGRGIIHEPDDIRPNNPPSNPELLAYLERELVNSKYDLRQVFRVILNSGTYRQSAIPRDNHQDAKALFAHYVPRQLDAEVLCDILSRLSGEGESYASLVPEPFTFTPDYERAVKLADGTITDSFLELFGRPPRDTGLESERSNRPSVAQRRWLLNSTDISKKIGAICERHTPRKTADLAEIVAGLYLAILSREPTDEEVTVAREYAQNSRLPRPQALRDLVWALINSKEFLYRH